MFLIEFYESRLKKVVRSRERNECCMCLARCLETACNLRALFQKQSAKAKNGVFINKIYGSHLKMVVRSRERNECCTCFAKSLVTACKLRPLFPERERKGKGSASQEVQNRIRLL